MKPHAEIAHAALAGWLVVVVFFGCRAPEPTTPSRGTNRSGRDVGRSERHAPVRPTVQGASSTGSAAGPADAGVRAVRRTTDAATASSASELLEVLTRQESLYAVLEIDGKRECVTLRFESGKRPRMTFATSASGVLYSWYEFEGETLHLTGAMYSTPTGTGMVQCESQSTIGGTPAAPTIDGATLFFDSARCAEHRDNAHPLPRRPPGKSAYRDGEWCWDSFARAAQLRAEARNRPHPELEPRQRRLVQRLSRGFTFFWRRYAGCERWVATPAERDGHTWQGKLQHRVAEDDDPIVEGMHYALRHHKSGMLDLDVHSRWRRPNSGGIVATGDISDRSLALDDPATVGVEDWYASKELCESAL